MNEEIILKKFAERFSSLIKSNGIDIPELAQRLGLKSKSTIYRYMNAEMAPKIPTVKYVSEIFNVNPVWLMGYDVPIERDTSNIQYDENTLRHIENYNKLNDLGKQTADIYIEGLTEVPKFTEKKETSQEANG